MHGMLEPNYFWGLKMLLSTVNYGRYVKVLQFASSISRLFSENDSAYINYRVVEQAFIRTSDATDLSRQDLSFDALTRSGVGIGIKTFLGTSGSQKLEKIAEFTNQAARGNFVGLSHEEKAETVANLRNKRLASDASELGIDHRRAEYHCVVRSKGSGFIHEEPMAPMEISAIQPTTPGGSVAKKFPSISDGHVYFTDGNAQYKYDVSKNTLFKRFDLATGKNSELFDLPIREDIWDLLLQGDVDLGALGVSSTDQPQTSTSLDLVVLPLYSTRAESYGQVLPKSGINQWNAGDQARKFGEAYIPVPSAVRERFPDFFPGREKTFSVALPNGKIVKAKICQDGGKALMAEPNTELLEWLFPILDGGENKMLGRLRNQLPYTTSDLVRVDRDSVIIEKSKDPIVDYTIRTAPLGSYEAFMTDENV